MEPLEIKPSAMLVLTQGGTVGREFPVTQAETRIGRWDNDTHVRPEIDLSDEDLDFRVSREHACIRVLNGHHYLFDCHSKNGTWVNRQKCQQAQVAYLLTHGDEVAIGSIFFRFVLVNHLLIG